MSNLNFFEKDDGEKFKYKFQVLDTWSGTKGRVTQKLFTDYAKSGVFFLLHQRDTKLIKQKKSEVSKSLNLSSE